MKLFLKDDYDNKTLNIENNILLIYGENQSGKTKFLESLMQLLNKKNNHLFDQREFDDFRDFSFIGEDWDLKKELTFNKTSPLRKIVMNNLRVKLEEKNYDLFYEFKENFILNFLLEELTKLIDVKNHQYKITPKFDFNNEQDIIDKLFKLKITNLDNDDLNENMIPKSIKAKLFIKLLVEVSTEKKIFIFDTPDTFLDYDEQKELWELLKILSKKNLVIITFRNPLFLKNSFKKLKYFYYLNNNNIKELKISKQLLIYFYLFEDHNRVKEINDIRDLNSKIEELNTVLEEEDFVKFYENFYQEFLIEFLINFDSKKLTIREVLALKEDNKKLKYWLFLKNNNLNLKEFKFRDPLIIKLIEYLS